ncbi:MAG: AraC family transcriptional regulator ligand-binding domain-containing protein [Myxococcota bacterium]
MNRDPASLHLVSGAWTRKVTDALERLGMDAEEICKNSGVDHAAMTDPEARFPRDDLVRFWNAADQMSDDPLLGLHAGEQTGARYSHVLSMLMSSGKTLGDSVEFGLRYQHLMADGNWASLGRRGVDYVVRIDRVQDALLTNDHQREMMVSAICELFRVITLGAFKAKEIHFDHSFRGLVEEYERVFECPVMFDQEATALVFDENMWSLELAMWDPALSGVLEALAAERQEQLEDAGVLGSVVLAIRGLLPNQVCDLEAVARAVGMSDRTLQRRLQEERTTFREVVDATRRSIVETGLASEVSHAELARRAGYASVRVLRRSVARWQEEDAVDAVKTSADRERSVTSPEPE